MGKIKGKGGSRLKPAGHHAVKKKHTWKSVREKKSTKPVESPSKPDKDPTINKPKSSTSSLRSRMLDRLSIARFRSLNADIDAKESASTQNPLSRKETFKSYHKGFETASSLWKQNPLDLISDWIVKSIPKNHVVADFGCGSGKLAKAIPNRTHSFDLHALEDHVTECDMRSVPLDDGTVHVAVFILSLMAADVTEFVVEARRVLVDGGVLKIAEAAARLGGNNMRKFISGMRDVGFKKRSVEEVGVFVVMEFTKIGGRDFVARKSASVVLGPCVYKKR